ncbi:MAG: hypothetical protein AB7E72_16340 [Lysobacterales bacterium]
MGKRIREVRRIAIERSGAFRCDVYQWLLDPRNVEVWRMFEREANRVWLNKANKHYSARTIVEYLRHHSAANDSGSDFKINDHHAPVLARLWTFLYPERAGFFEFRGITVGVAA